MTFACLPADVPRMRDELLLWLDSRAATDRLDRVASQGRLDHVFPDAAHRPDRRQAYMRWQKDKLREADLYYVSPEMAKLAHVAADSLPPCELHREDVPSRSGFLVFGGRGEVTRNVDESRELLVGELLVGMHAAFWSAAPYAEDSGIVMSFYTSKSGMMSVANELSWRESFASDPRLIWMPADLKWMYGNNESATGRVEHGDVIATSLRSTWLLMQQKIARVQEVAPDRAARRRAAREGREAPAVRVIELRRPDVPRAPGMSDREYHHQWIVRGHWRMQPYGPERSRQRPVWIAPHVKGPEGAPMLGGEKVYAWKR